MRLAQGIDHCRQQAGKRDDPTTNSKPRPPSSGTSSQLPSNNTSKDSGTRLRRRLSKIFHCESTESGLAMRRASEPGTRGRSHCVICQSPRIQR